MKPLLDDDEDFEDRPGRDREITLGTTMILLIFFALAVYGAALFGFGYSLGSKHNGGTIAAAPTAAGSFGTFKPSPGSPVGGATAGTQPAVETATVPYTAPVPVKADVPAVKAEASDFEDAASKAKTAPVAPAPTAPGPAAVAASAAPSVVPVAGFGTVVVQVAALTHQEDADMIATTLKRRGYTVTVRTEADKLVHVQVGPFATKKDAETMKAKLLADGFNAYIK